MNPQGYGSGRSRRHEQPSRPVVPPVNHRIVYVVKTAPGGEDGKSRDKGGVVVQATYDYEVAFRRCVDSRYIFKPEVVDSLQAREEALKKLSPLDRLVLGID